VVTTPVLLVPFPAFFSPQCNLVLTSSFHRNCSKPTVPPIKGLDVFEGMCTRTALWPREGINLENKREGVIGTRASGIQVIQKTGAPASHLIVFQCSSQITFPMCRNYKVHGLGSSSVSNDSGRNTSLLGKTRRSGIVGQRVQACPRNSLTSCGVASPGMRNCQRKN
jgi:hypothetical protein